MLLMLSGIFFSGKSAKADSFYGEEVLFTVSLNKSQYSVGENIVAYGAASYAGCINYLQEAGLSVTIGGMSKNFFTGARVGVCSGTVCAAPATLGTSVAFGGKTTTPGNFSATFNGQFLTGRTMVCSGGEMARDENGNEYMTGCPNVSYVYGGGMVNVGYSIPYTVIATDNGCAANTCTGSTCWNGIATVNGTKNCCTPSWTPPASGVCSGQTFTQNDGCGGTQAATGTSSGGAFSPDPSTQCSGTSFSQTNACTAQWATGTKTDGYCCVDTSWFPDGSRTCSRDSFEQTSNCGRTQTVFGTKDCTKWKETAPFE